MNLRWLIEDRVQRNPEKTFIFFKDRTYTYAQMNLVVNRIAHAFLSLGIKAGDRVAIMLPNCPEFLFTWFGLAKIGAVEVLVNTQLKGTFLRHQLQTGESRVVVVGEPFQENFVAVHPGLGHLRQVVFLGPERKPNHAGEKGLSFWNWIQSFPDHPPPEMEIKEDHPISIMFTSGTTGPSKGVLNGQKAYLRCGEDCAQYLGLTPEDRCYVVLPLYHGNPQMMAVMTALWIGGSLVMSERFSASRFLDEVRRYGATYFTYVGTILTTLCKQPEKPDDRKHSLRLGFGGGAPKDVWQTMENRFGVRIYEAYGMIEAGCVTSINRQTAYRFGSMGIPRDCLEIRTADEQDEELPQGSSGEIQVRPREPFVMFEGYFGLPELTLAAYLNLWFHTGDRGKMDQDGFVYFEGRLKNTIRRKGENISPEAIENILNANPRVLESAVVGVPDEISGEEIKAFIIPKPDEHLSLEEVIAWCREGLPEFMIPRYIEFRKEFPKTGSEKIQKYKLLQEQAKETWERMEK